MDALSNVTGLKDLIASHVPISKLPDLGKASLQWEAPAKDAALPKLTSKILAFQECVSAWISFADPDGFWGLMCNPILSAQEWHHLTRGGGHKTPGLLGDFIKKNKQGGVKKFKELKKQFLEQVELEEWKLADPRRKHPKIPEHHPIVVIHKQGAQVFDFRIKIEDAKQDILSLLQFLYPEEMEKAGKKLPDFTYSKPKTMIDRLYHIIRYLPREVACDLLPPSWQRR